MCVYADITFKYNLQNVLLTIIAFWVWLSRRATCNVDIALLAQQQCIFHNFTQQILFNSWRPSDAYMR